MTLNNNHRNLHGYSVNFTQVILSRRRARRIQRQRRRTMNRIIQRQRLRIIIAQLPSQNTINPFANQMFNGSSF
ncbi:390_t:CDS:2 [Rhizophagus irregularis]|nr:390_t:CDS:2 [Rhizophagus irregularis]